MTTLRRKQEEIAEGAYELYIKEGCHHGRDLEHWLQAEKELGSQAAPTVKAARKPSPKKAVALPVSKPAAKKAAEAPARKTAKKKA